MRNKKTTSIFILVLILTALSFLKDYNQNDESSNTSHPPSNTSITTAFKNQKSDIIVTGQGRVVKLLKDDTEGSRHQRVIVQIAPSHTILIAHNIDLAPRAAIKTGDQISFKGEYEWNKKGGVLHWTHHDPRGKHPGGWLEVKGKRYQ